VIRQEHQRATGSKLQPSNPRAHRLNRESDTSAQHGGEIREVAGDVPAWHVHEVEMFEGKGSFVRHRRRDLGAVED
jgi:hypothetical protein